MMTVLTALVVCAWPGVSLAQDKYRYTVGLLAGAGGTFGSEPSSVVGSDVFLRQDQFELAVQAYYRMETTRQTYFSVRAGQLEVEVDRLPFSAPVSSELTYVTAAGEYTTPADFYVSGLFFGLGYYSVDTGGLLAGDDTGPGVTVGTYGDFRINDRWSVLLEFSGHYADLDVAQIFVMGHVGLGFRF